MLSKSLPFLAVSSFLLLVAGSLGTEVLIFTSNATSVDVGKSAKLACQLKNQSKPMNVYSVSFYQGGEEFCKYFITASGTEEETTLFNNETSTLRNLGRHTVSWTYPVFEITITPTTAGSYKYECGLNPYVSEEIFSKPLLLTVTPLSNGTTDL